MGLFDPKYSFRLEPVESGTAFVAEFSLRIGPLEGHSPTDHAELEEGRRHMGEGAVNLKPFVVPGAGLDDEHTEATAA